MICKKIAAFLMLCLIGVFAVSCEKAETGRDFLFFVPITDNPNNLDPQLADNNSAYSVISNLYVGLMSYNEHGMLTNGVAKSYSISDDELKYEFELGENYWYGKNINEPIPITADDFVYAFERLKSQKLPMSEIFKNVWDVKAIEVKKVQFSLLRPEPDFLKLLTLPAASPCNRELFENCKGRYGLDEESIPSNGSFYVTKWQFDPYGSDNVIYSKRIKSNNLPDSPIAPNGINYQIMTDAEDYKSQKTYFFDNKNSCLLLPQKQKSDNFETLPYEQYFDKTIGIIANDTDKNILKVLSATVNRDFKTQLPAHGIIPPNVTELGKYYREIVSDKFSITKVIPGDVNPSQRLSIMICKGEVDMDVVYHVKDFWEETCGFTITLEILAPEIYTERIKSKDYQLAIRALTSSYDSAKSFLSIFDFSREIFSKLNSINFEKDIIMQYAEIERQILEENEFIPLYYDGPFIYHKSKNAGFVYLPFSHQLMLKYAKYYQG